MTRKINRLEEQLVREVSQERGKSELGGACKVRAGAVCSEISKQKRRKGSRNQGKKN